MLRNIAMLFLVFILFITGCGSSSSEGLSVIDSDVKFGENDYEEIIHANNDLGFNLLPIVEPNDHHNVFISPTSLYMALSMTYNGADGKTKKEMAEVLQTHDMDVSQLNGANASLLSSLYKDTGSIELRIGNSLWLNEDYHFQDQFSKDAIDYFNGELQEIDIFDSHSVDIINNWVDEATNGNIDQIVDGPLSEGLIAFLINAIYFKGDWVHEFDKKVTKDAPFYLRDDSEIDVAFMRLEKELPYFETEDFQAIKLPYGDGEMSMNVFLPKEHVSLEKFQDQLTSDHWKGWSGKFRDREGTILLPKFQLEYEIKLNDALEELGMIEAFNESKANFSNLIQEARQIYVHEVKQKTFLDVNEEGTEAAAATVVEMRLESAIIPLNEPFFMEVNRPFFLTITDEQTGAILFMGTIHHPQQP